MNGALHIMHFIVANLETLDQVGESITKWNKLL